MKKENDGNELIEMQPSLKNKLNRWLPEPGTETNDLMHRLEVTEESKQTLVSEAVEILAKCMPPTPISQSETGLVIGYVQSGKTMSFTTVAALARDNKYQVVIIIGGTSKILFDQSQKRLLRDLNIEARTDRKWQHFSNPKKSKSDIDIVRSTLSDWKDPETPDNERSTLLITVMKHFKRLHSLTDLIESIGFQGVPTLIIDDEADQASLNNLVSSKLQSSTYEAIIRLRDATSNHSFLQYTATPQAPLLINTIDTLSPKFAQVLTAGPGYTGGKQFFIDTPNMIAPIPSSDVLQANRKALPEPPGSLLEAMRMFFLGVAAGYETNQTDTPRSMMVHPSENKDPHSQYHFWVHAIKDRWVKSFALSETDPDRRELVDEFRSSYANLKKTVGLVLPSFDILIKHMRKAIEKVNISKVNSDDIKVINWRRAYAHILIGGKAMDRGFTVEGLTVTYMPRGLGVGNADTIQQRARFFGYKKRYLEYCRVFLQPNVSAAYRAYVEHEEDIREKLLSHSNQGKTLTEWKRAFFLDTAFQPTRSSVLTLQSLQSNFNDDWFYPRAPQNSPNYGQDNCHIIDDFTRSLVFHEDPGHPDRTDATRHLLCSGVSLKSAYEELLTKLVFMRPIDSRGMTGVLLQIGRFLSDQPDAKCRIYKMSPNKTRQRNLTPTGELVGFMQGKSDATKGKKRGEVYPGDENIKDKSELTIQIHLLKLPAKTDTVPAVAVWMPAQMAKAWYTQ